MRQVSIRQAKRHLSQLVDAASGGEPIILTRAGKPLAVLAPLPPTPVFRRPGLLAGRIFIQADFDEPLPEAITQAFEGTL